MPAPPPSSTGPRLGAVQVTSSPEGDRPDLAESSSSLSVPKAQVSAEKGSGPTTRRSGGTRARSGGAGSREALHAVGPLRGPVLQELPVGSLPAPRTRRVTLTRFRSVLAVRECLLLAPRGRFHIQHLLSSPLPAPGKRVLLPHAQLMDE